MTIPSHIGTEKNTLQEAPKPTIPIAPVAPSIASNATEGKKWKPPSPICPFCRKSPFHLRSECPVVQERGPALKQRVEELRKGDQAGTERGGQLVANEIDRMLEIEDKRDRLRAANTKVKVAANARGKKRATTSEVEEEDAKSEMDEDPDTPDEDEEDDRADSMPRSLERPTTSSHSLVTVLKPGEGSDTASSSDEEDAEDDTLPLQVGDEDAEMHDGNRSSTSVQSSDDATSKISSRMGSSFAAGLSEKPDPSQLRANEVSSAARIPQSFRDINDKSSEGPDNAVYEKMKHDTAEVLVLNSDDSSNEDMVDADQNGSVDASPSRGLMDSETRDTLFQRRGSPVAKGRTPGTPGRIKVMKDRHGNTAPVSRNYGNDSDEDDGSPTASKASLLPDYQRKAASQPMPDSSTKDLYPRLSNFVRSINPFGSTPLARSMPATPSQPTPISVPLSGRPVPKVSTMDASDESSSSSSSDSEKKSRIPKAQRAGSRPSGAPKQSIFSQM
ncbi:hypothetical protein M408DRAFT_328611 [Serendipita vermifera MAFF 305830]|uniref:Uncharacterized protein n=1 Tax=Serendipita vermifera MAFF 305830 TaxID=933852 RepID=A0A0C2XLA1_SERVB|nr:hypothetical protein M408DRAFT_328611 [Serendipita vermifera MAFF 305830]